MPDRKTLPRGTLRAILDQAGLTKDVLIDLLPKNREATALKFNRITVNPLKMGGVPCIRALRIPVATVVGMVADGMTTEEILRSFPDLERDEIRESLQYAAEALHERELPLAVGS